MTEDKGQALVPFTKDGGSGQAIAPVMAHALAVWSERYGLDPFAGQVIYYFGQPYVTEKGAIANACNSERYMGFSCSMLGPEEMKRMRLDPNCDIAYMCCVHIKDYKEPVVEYGEVRQTEIDEASRKFGANAPFLPIVRFPVKMARARAIRRAHLIAFPLVNEGQEEKAETGQQLAQGGIAQLPPEAPEKSPWGKFGDEMRAKFGEKEALAKVCELLGCTSLKKEWIEAGKSPDEARRIIHEKLGELPTKEEMWEM